MSLDRLSVLPSEILAQIAQNVRFKDFNSLYRTNRDIHRKLAHHRNVLPKTDGDVYLKISGDFTKLCIFLKILRRCDWYTTERCCQLNGQPLRERYLREYTDEEKEDQVAEFYYKFHRGQKKQLFPLTIADGLVRHLQFLLPRVNIKKLTMETSEADLVAEITRQITKHRTRVDELIMNWYMIGHYNMDLISKCNVMSLSITSESRLQDGHFERAVPMIYKLTNLQDLARREYTLPGDELLALSLTKLSISGATSITPKGVVDYIRRWSERKMEFQCVILHLDTLAVGRDAGTIILDSLGGQPDLKGVIVIERKTHIEACVSRVCDSLLLVYKCNFETKRKYLEIPLKTVKAYNPVK